MKFLFFSFLCCCCLSDLRAQYLINSATSGKWSQPDTWDLKRIPREGDIIVIGQEHTVQADAPVQLKNVLFRISGTLRIMKNQEVQLDANSTVNIFVGGNLVSENQEEHSVLRIGNTVKYRGNKVYINSWGAGVIKGLASTAINTGGDIDQGGSGFLFGSVPSTWQDFNVFKTSENKVQMVWVTSHESGKRFFEIQRRNDEGNWNPIGLVTSDGNPSPENIYSFIDNTPGTGRLQYRVKHSDADGRFKYSAVRSLKIYPENPRFTIYPNPARNAATLDYPASPEKPLLLKIINSGGQILKSAVLPAKSNRYTIDLGRENAGIYHVQLVFPDGRAEILTFCKY